MKLYLMQHGKALPKEKDPQKGLSPEGREQIELSAKALKRLGLSFDVIASSPKKRAKQTAEIVAKECEYEGEVIINSVFEPLAPPEEAISFLKGLKKENIFVAGHLPSLGEIASRLLSETEVLIQFQMGGICHILLENDKGKLIFLLTPEQLKLLSQG
ncbi:MAG TPA: phosphohistidine phosphatase SixA [Candidatus Desulfofervidus auxilii]|uniref:Phosphohistidine phosphatase SixA n=1 Tax=Desulfofervidus auxilii TaxID=1621989 RepID=A0A7V0NEZ8_DESA2|nr:phosphohistidine phosphatase SixA [Candidatus Desulfofervidus auxilii]